MYLPLYKVADTPFHSQGEDLIFDNEGIFLVLTMSTVSAQHYVDYIFVYLYVWYFGVKCEDGRPHRRPSTTTVSSTTTAAKPKQPEPHTGNKTSKCLYIVCIKKFRAIVNLM